MDRDRLSRCLVLVDLQNEFLSAQGRFPIHGSSRKLLDNITKLVVTFRASGDPIIWVRAEYDNATSGSGSAEDDSDPSHPTNLLSGTHRGRKPCCQKGTTGADFSEDIASLITASCASENIIITKTWYSAFRETTLLTELQNRNITNIFVGGLMTNICVHATVVNACDLGFAVSVVEDCLGWRNRESHDRALRQMIESGVRVIASDRVNAVSTLALVESQPHLPCLYYVNGSIPTWRVFIALYEKIVKFHPTRLKVMGEPKETRLPEFLALNHRGKAPVFVDVLPSSPTTGDPTYKQETIIVNESLAIPQYIETYYNSDRPLLPPVSQQAARALVLSRLQETENLHRAYGALEDAYFTKHANGKLGDTERAFLINAVDRELDLWEVYAEKTEFIAGNEFGLADCALFPLLAYMVHRGFEWKRQSPAPVEETNGLDLSVKKSSSGQEPGYIEAWPHLKAYFQRVWDRGGEHGCARRAQLEGWARRGKTNIWKETKKQR